MARVPALAINAIPPSWMIKYGHDLVKALLETRIDGLKHLSLVTLKALMKNPDGACKHIPALSVLEFNSDVCSAMTPDCFAVLKEIDTVDLRGSFLDALPVGILSKYSGSLTINTLRNTNPVQLELLGSQVEGPICQDLDIGEATVLNYVSAKCLRGILMNKETELESPLPYLRPALIEGWQEYLPDVLPTLIESNNYCHLPRALKLKFITDEIYLILERLGKRAILREFTMTAREFCSSGNDSIRWLQHTEVTLPDGFLSRCDSVGSIFTKQKEWRLLANNNRNVIKNMTSATETHFCATLSEEEYSKNPILRRFGGDACRQALQFKRTAKVQKRLPELRKEHSPISSKWWGTKGAILGMLLIEDGSKWKPSPRSMQYMSNSSLSLIDGSIALYYRKYISPENAKKLAWNAFERFAATDFIGLQFTNLSPRQIRHLSTALFSTITVAQLSALDSRQLGAITSDQWVSLGSAIATLPAECLGFIPFEAVHRSRNHITPKVAPKLNYDAFRLFSKSDFTLNLANLRPEQISKLSAHLPNNEDAICVVPVEQLTALDDVRLNSLSALRVERNVTETRLKTLFAEAKLLSVTGVRRVSRIASARNIIGACYIVALMQAYKLDVIPEIVEMTMKSLSDNERSRLSRIVGNSVSLLLTTNGDIAKLRMILLKLELTINGPNPRNAYANIHNGGSFDLQASLKAIDRYPALFTQRTFRLNIPGAIDAGAPLRGWIEFLLNHIRDTKMIADGLKYKFGWLNNRKDGWRAGLIFGKAFQLDMRLPFMMDFEFLFLLVNCPGRDVERYFYKTFAAEIKEYKDTYLGQAFGPEQFLCEDLEVLDPNKLHFKGTLDANVVKADERIPMSNYSHETIITDYFERELLPRIVTEYVAFVKGFGHGFSKFVFAERLCGLRMERVQNIFDQLLGPKESTIDIILPLIKWTDSLDAMVASVVRNRPISVKNVVKSFLKALTLPQLQKFIRIWTGATGTAIKQYSLKVQVLDPSPSSISSVKDLWDKSVRSGENPESMLIAPGKQYRVLLRRIEVIQQKMLGVETGKRSGSVFARLHKNKVWSARISSCLGSLEIIRQPAVEIIQSLVELLNMPPDVFMD